MSEFETSRRNLLYGIAAAGAAAPVLAACGSSDGGAPTADVTAPGSTGTPGTGGTASETPAAGIPTSDIPVGGGAIYPDDGFVITQPSAGDFKAFSATCTHSGCAVSSVQDGTINCPCHGSKFSIEDGSVQGGPARSSLPAKTISVDGASITVT